MAQMENVDLAILARIRNAGMADYETLADNLFKISLLKEQKLHAGPLFGETGKEIGYFSFLHKKAHEYIIPEPVLKDEYCLVVDCVQTVNNDVSQVICQQSGEPFPVLFTEKVGKRKLIHFLASVPFYSVFVFFKNDAPYILIQNHFLYGEEKRIQFETEKAWESPLAEFLDGIDAPYSQFGGAADAAYANLRGLEVVYGR